MNTAFTLERLQQELSRALKWTEKAINDAKHGEFSSACYCATVAMQYWNNCQHQKDKYLPDEESEKIKWDFFIKQAQKIAEQELKTEGE